MSFSLIYRLGNCMVSIIDIQWAYLFISFFCIIPSALLLRYYAITHVLDYLIFAFVFIFVSINQFSSYIMIEYPRNVILNQIVTSSYILVYLFIYFHAIRLNHEKSPKLLWLLGFIPYMILQILIMFYKTDGLPKTANLFVFTMHNVDSYEVGVGFKTGNIILMGQGFDYLISIYRIFTLLYAIYAYFNTKIAVSDNRLQIVRYLWITIGVLTMGRPFMYLFDLFTNLEFSQLTRSSFDLFAIFVIPFIIIRYPEYVLISKTQLIRAAYLYKKVKSININQTSTQTDIDQIYKYIRNLPPEIFRNIREMPKKFISKAKKIH